MLTKTFTLLEADSNKYKFVCKECRGETMHQVVTTYKEHWAEDFDRHSVEGIIRSQIIQCLGCESVSFRVTSTNTEDFDYDEHNVIDYFETVTFYPSRSEGLRSINRYELPSNVGCIYEETVLAIENNQTILAGIGIRALIETICRDLEIKGKNLYSKIEDLAQKNIVTKEGAYALHKLRILGNDAAHEVKSHTKAQLLVAIGIIEHMLDGTYILPNKISQQFDK